MSNQDSGDRKPFGRQLQIASSSSGLRSESSYKTPGKSDETPPVSGRGRMLAALAAVSSHFFL